MEVTARKAQTAGPQQEKITETDETHPEELLGEPEPWESWETKLVVYCIAIGIGGLVILGTLINIFILN